MQKIVNTKLLKSGYFWGTSGTLNSYEQEKYGKVGSKTEGLFLVFQVINVQVGLWMIQRNRGYPLPAHVL